MKYLIKFEANWADEFDCEQFMLTKDCPMCYMDEILKEGAWGFGTNQDFEELNTDNFQIVELTDEEAYTIEKFFGMKFGVGVL